MQSVVRRSFLNRAVLKVLVLSFLLAIGPACCAADYPAKPIKLVVPYPAGSTTDVAARMIGIQLGNRVKQAVVVENRPGSSGIIGARFVVQAPPDGYTLLYISGVTLTSIFVKNDAIDVLKELAPVSAMQQGSYYLMASSKLPVANYKEMLAYSKSHPGKLNLGSQAKTSTLAMSVLASRTGLDFVDVPYKGSADIANGLINGDLAFAFDNVTAYMPFIRDGRIKVLFVAARDRSPVLPGAQTSDEAGASGFYVPFVQGLWAPAATPKDIIAKLARECEEIARDPGVRQHSLDAMSARAIGSSPEEFRRIVDGQIQFWTEAARIAHYQPE